MQLEIGGFYQTHSGEKYYLVDKYDEGRGWAINISTLQCCRLNIVDVEKQISADDYALLFANRVENLYKEKYQMQSIIEGFRNIMQTMLGI